MSFNRRVIALVRRIPRGKVTTYGLIAAAAGSPRAAITVGKILHRNSEHLGLPWQRVINNRGIISTTCFEHPQEVQAELLRIEGVEVSASTGLFSVNLDKYLWKP